MIKEPNNNNHTEHHIRLATFNFYETSLVHSI